MKSPSFNRRMALLGALVASVAGSAHAQDAARIQPNSYRVRLDNDRVRVLEFTGQPGMGVCGNGVHSHPDHLTVLLTPAHVRVRVGDKVQIVNLPAGASFWEPAVTHETENLGTTPVRSLIIELKTPHS